MCKASTAFYLVSDNSVMKYITKYEEIETQRVLGNECSLLPDKLEAYIGRLCVRGAYEQNKWINMGFCYKPAAHTTVGEQLVPTKARCTFSLCLASNVKSKYDVHEVSVLRKKWNGTDSNFIGWVCRFEAGWTIYWLRHNHYYRQWPKLAKILKDDMERFTTHFYLSTVTMTVL